MNPHSYLIKEALRFRRMLSSLSDEALERVRDAGMLTAETERRMSQGVRGVSPSEFVGSREFASPSVLAAPPSHYAKVRRPFVLGEDPEIFDPAIMGTLQKHLETNYPGLNVLKQLGSGAESAALLVAPNAYTRRVTGQAGPVVLKISGTTPPKLTKEMSEEFLPMWGRASAEARPWWSAESRKLHTWLEPAVTPLGQGTTDFYKRIPGKYARYRTSKPELLRRRLEKKDLATSDLHTMKVPYEGQRVWGAPGSIGPQAGWQRTPEGEKLVMLDRGAAVPAGEVPEWEKIRTLLAEARAADYTRASAMLEELRRHIQLSRRGLAS